MKRKDFNKSPGLTNSYRKISKLALKQMVKLTVSNVSHLRAFVPQPAAAVSPVAHLNSYFGNNVSGGRSRL